MHYYCDGLTVVIAQAESLRARKHWLTAAKNNHTLHWAAARTYYVHFVISIENILRERPAHPPDYTTDDFEIIRAVQKVRARRVLKLSSGEIHPDPQGQHIDVLARPAELMESLLLNCQYRYPEGLHPTSPDAKFWVASLTKLKPYLIRLSKIDHYGGLTAEMWQIVSGLSSLVSLSIRQTNTIGTSHDTPWAIGSHPATIPGLLGWEALVTCSLLKELEIGQIQLEETGYLGLAISRMRELETLNLSSCIDGALMWFVVAIWFHDHSNGFPKSLRHLTIVDNVAR